MEKRKKIEYHFLPFDREKILKEESQDFFQDRLKDMLLIRNFEIRAESAYQQGKVGGFFHAYIGQEAIQTAAVAVMGRNQWWLTTYRCHALALLLGATPNELMAELYGKENGNAMGRGGSMHFYTDRLLGGFGIVGGQIPVAIGAAFTLRYLEQEGAAVCFLGDGAVAQGAFHESLNLAALWDLPCIFVIENNQWGMGTPVSRAISLEPIAETKAPAYGIKGYSLDGMDFFSCYAGFKQVYREVLQTSRPVLIEVVTERFRGHSISDPALYRSKVELEGCVQRDPIQLFYNELKRSKLCDDATFETMDKAQKDLVIAAMKYADESPLPNPITLGQDVFAP